MQWHHCVAEVVGVHQSSRPYLSSVSPSPLVSSVTVASEQLSFLRLCFWLTDSAWWSEFKLSCSVLACVSPLVFSWETEETCPFSPVWWLETRPSDDSELAACRLCLLMVFLRSLATFRAELFLFRGGGSFFPSSPPSPSERDKGPTDEHWMRRSKKTQFFGSSCTLVPADALNRLTRNLTIELEELVGNCSQDFDLAETTC